MNAPSTHRAPPSSDELLKVAQAMRIPDSFRPQRQREVRGSLPHGVDWIEDQLEPLRSTAMAAAYGPGSEVEVVRARAQELVVRATFASRIDGFAHPDPEAEIDVDDAVWSFDGREADRFENWNRVVFTPAAGFAARRGDVMLHGDPIAPALGSPNVTIGGRPALRSCDTHVCTSTTPTPHAAAGFVATYDKVMINGFPALRVGDYVDEGPHGLDPITVGCPSVVIGPRPEPVECWRLDEARPTELPDRVPFRWHPDHTERHERKVVLGAELGGRVQVEGTTTAARLWAERHTAADPRHARKPLELRSPKTPAEYEHVEQP